MILLVKRLSIWNSFKQIKVLAKLHVSCPKLTLSLINRYRIILQSYIRYCWVLINNITCDLWFMWSWFTLSGSLPCSCECVFWQTPQTEKESTSLVKTTLVQLFYYFNTLTYLNWSCNDMLHMYFYLIKYFHLVLSSSTKGLPQSLSISSITMIVANV